MAQQGKAAVALRLIVLFCGMKHGLRFTNLFGSTGTWHEMMAHEMMAHEMMSCRPRRWRGVMAAYQQENLAVQPVCAVPVGQRR
jgi:hypothetical protein